MATMGHIAECRECGQRDFERDSRTLTLTVGDTAFQVKVAQSVCRNCGEGYVDGPAIEAAELAVAERLAESGAVTPESFRFMRQALKLRGEDLAGLLSVAAETISRWENGKRELDRSAWVLVAEMVRDERRGGDPRMRRTLEALRKPHPLPKSVRIAGAARVKRRAIPARRTGRKKTG